MGFGLAIEPDQAECSIVTRLEHESAFGSLREVRVPAGDAEVEDAPPRPRGEPGREGLLGLDEDALHERVTEDDHVGTLERFDTFRPDPEVPFDWYRVQTFDYTNSGFDRGHMVPNADRDKETSIPINQATFLMTNILPQAPDNNQGPWGDLENYLRTLLPANEVYIVAGGHGAGGTGSNGGVTFTIAGGQVSVPALTWKVALVISKDSGDDISRVTCSARTIAVNMPNVQGIRNNPWENYLTTVDAIETLTGYDLCSNLPAHLQNCVDAELTPGRYRVLLDRCKSPDSCERKYRKLFSTA